MEATARHAAERLRVLHELNTPLTVLSGRLQLWRRHSGRTGGDVTLTSAELDDFIGLLVRLARAVSSVEAGAHESQERYRAIVELATDYAMFTTDAAGRIDAWLPGAAAVLGWSEAEAVGQPFGITFTPEDRAADVPEQELALARGAGSTPNVRWHLRKDGARVFIEGMARGRTGADGTFLGILKVGRDATERRLAERRRREEEERVRGELERRVAEATMDVRDLSRRLMLAQEEECRRLALELHDAVGQVLTALGLQLASRTGDEPSEDRLAGSRRIVAGLIERVRQLSMDLRPAALDRFGLLPALRWHLERLGGQTGIAVHLQHEGAERRFPPEVEIAAYRVVQEALTNVARHANATEATVQLFSDDAALAIVVRDKGRGLNRSLPESGSGLGGMRERAELLGDTLVVDAEPGAGVTITAELPIAEQSR